MSLSTTVDLVAIGSTTISIPLPRIFRLRRNVSAQGIEANLYSFGIMGARRMGNCGPRCGSRLADLCGFGAGACGPNGCDQNACDQNACGPGYGRRTSSSSERISLEGSVDLSLVLAADASKCETVTVSVGSNSTIRLNWQPILMERGATRRKTSTTTLMSKTTCTATSLAAWCLTVSETALCSTRAGKFGLYGNDASVQQRVGTLTTVAYTNAQGAGAGDVNTDYSDTVLAGLGELDFGGGYRISCRCTIRGGYRMLAACGVATSTDAIADEFSMAASAGSVQADDCLVLHGGYIGLDYNW